MAGTLDFKLGLATAGFVGPLGGATSALNKFLGVGAAVGTALGAITGLGAGLHGVFHQIEEGGRLFDMGERLKESAGSLFALEFAFDQIGEAAGSVGPVLWQVNKSLGGLNESGEPTVETFEQLGLSIEALTKLRAEEKLLAIGKALSSLPVERQANLAAKLAGRGGAQTLQAIANSTDDFAAALAKAAPQAAIVARNAAAFDRIGDTMKEVKLQSTGLFLGIAEGAAPGIQLALDKLNNMDLTGLGQRLGDTILGLTEAFQQSRFGEVFELSMKAGIQEGSNFMLGEIAKWSEAMRLAMNPPEDNKHGLLTKLGAGTAGVGVGLINLWSEIGSMIDPRLVDQELLDKRAEFVNKMFDISGLDGGILDGIQIGTVTNQFGEKLTALLDELIEAGRARIEANATGPAKSKPPEDEAKTLAELFPTGPAFASGNNFPKFNRNGLESAGGYFSNAGRNPATDYARRTADGVGRTNQLIQNLTKVIIDRNQSIEKLTPWSHAD